MTYTSMTLSDPASGYSSVIKPRDGVSVMALDVQSAVRAVTFPQVQADGVIDQSMWLDTAACTLALRLFTSDAGMTPEDYLDELSPLLGPWVRPVLTVTNDQWAGPRMLTLRFDSRAAPVDNPVTTDVALSWKVPSGGWSDTAATEFTVPAIVASTTGLHFTSAGAHFTSAGAHFPAGAASSGSIVTVAGSVRPPGRARIYGPCTGPRLTSDTAGGDIIFTSALALAAGQYLDLDSVARTANLNSDPGQSQLALLDFLNTTWWQLAPGPNLIRYHPLTGGGSAAVLDFTPGYLP